MALRIKRPPTAFSADKPKREVRGRKPLVIEAHRQWIRQLPSLITGEVGTVEAAHISMKDARAGKVSRGKSQKVDDFYLVPLSRKLHAEIHDIGEPAFEKKYGIDLVRIAMALYIHGTNANDAAAHAMIATTYGKGWEP